MTTGWHAVRPLEHAVRARSATLPPDQRRPPNSTGRRRGAVGRGTGSAASTTRRRHQLLSSRAPLSCDSPTPHVRNSRVEFIKHNQNYYLKLDVLTSSIKGLHRRRSWYSVLPVLDTTGRRRVKKAVVCVAQLVYSCPHHGSCPVVLPFRVCVASLIRLVKRSGSLSITVA